MNRFLLCFALLAFFRHRIDAHRGINFTYTRILSQSNNLDSFSSEIIASLEGALVGCNDEESRKVSVNSGGICEYVDSRTGFVDKIESAQLPKVCIDPTKNSVAKKLNCGSFSKQTKTPAALQTTKSTLIVMTSANDLKLTVFSLDQLKGTYHLADLIVIDDHSTDGTVEYLRKKGYAVISKSSARGAADSWSIGYQWAVEMGYKYVVFLDHDVVVSPQTIQILVEDLEEEDNTFLLPVTSMTAAGHNQAQALVRVHNVPEGMDRYVSNVHFHTIIQHALHTIRAAHSNHSSSSSSTNTAPKHPPLTAAVTTPSPSVHTIPSNWHSKPRVTNFCFAINIQRMQAITAKYPSRQLFLYRDEQGDRLMRKLQEFGIAPKISKYAFVYRFPSSSSSAPPSALAMETVPRLRRAQDTTVHHAAPATGKPHTHSRKGSSSSSGGESKHMRAKHSAGDFDSAAPTDRRRRLGYTASSTLGGFLQTLFHGDSGYKTPLTNGAVNDPVPSAAASTAGHQLQQQSQSKEKKTSSSASLIFTAANAENLFATVHPPKILSTLPDGVTAALPNNPDFYRWYSPSFTIRKTLTEYPTTAQFAHQLASISSRKIASAGNWEVAAEFESRTNIAFVLADHLTTAADSDDTQHTAAAAAAAAVGLGTALEQRYNVEIRYLQHTAQWYSAHALRNVDILISTVPEFDLGRVLALSEHSRAEKGSHIGELDGTAVITTKAAMIAVGWVLSAPQRWIAAPWIGNYDLLLASSTAIAQFLQTIQASIGLRVKCMQGCGHVSSSSSYAPLSTRVNTVPIALFLPATSSNMKSAVTDLPNQAASIVLDGKQTVFHYAVLTASHTTALPEFQSSSLPQWKGILVSIDDAQSSSSSNAAVAAPAGNNASSAPSSAAWKSVAVGKLAEEELHKIYAAAKVIVLMDDTADATWGTVHSAVLDAVVAGALVIISEKSRAAVESMFTPELMGGVKLPLYRSSDKELSALIAYFLGHDEERVKTVRAMQNIVEQKHLYSVRAVQLQEVLVEVNVKLAEASNPQRRKAAFDKPATLHRTTSPALQPRKLTVELEQSPPQTRKLANGDEQPITAAAAAAAEGGSQDHLEHPYEEPLPVYPPPSSNHTSLCIGVRTFEPQLDFLEVMLKGIVAQYKGSKYRDKLSLRIYVMNTEPGIATAQYSIKLHLLADEINVKLEQPVIVLLSEPPLNSGSSGGGHKGDPQEEGDTRRNTVYGYDATDLMVAHMTSAYSSRASHYDRQQQQQQQLDERYQRYYNSDTTSPVSEEVCEWILFTNGDNAYNAAWLDTAAVHMLSSDTDAIGWDFISHHPRGGVLHQLISIEWRRRYVDLASAMFRSKLYLQANGLYLPDGVFTKDLFARDFQTFSQLLEHSHPSGRKIVHECLLFHQ